MINDTFVSDCDANALVNDMHQSDLWYFACNNPIGLIRYSLITNTSEPMLPTNSSAANVYFLHQDSDGRLWFLTLSSNGLYYGCGYIAAPSTASPMNNSIIWVSQPNWMTNGWVPLSLAAHADLVYLALEENGVPPGPTLIRVNLTTDIVQPVRLFSEATCWTTFFRTLRYDWYLDSFITICDVGVVAIPYEISSPPYLLIPRPEDIDPSDVLRVNSGELFISFLGNSNGCAMVWSNVSSYEVVMNCDPHSCPSIESWSYSPMTDTVLVTCSTLASGAGAIVAIQSTQGELSVENTANIQSTILASVCSLSGPQLASIEPFSKGVAVLCEDGAYLFKGQAITLLISPPTCNVYATVKLDPTSNMLLIACDQNLLVIDGELQHTFSACSGEVSSIFAHSPGSHRTYTATVDQFTSNVGICVIQPITHEMMRLNIPPASQFLLQFNNTLPSLLMAGDDLLLIILDDLFVFLNESTNSTTTLLLPNQCLNASSLVVPMNGWIYVICYTFDGHPSTNLVRLDLSNVSAGWLEVMSLNHTCHMPAGAISTRPLTNQLYLPCAHANDLNLLVINCNNFTTNRIPLIINATTYYAYTTMVDPTSSYVFLYAKLLHAPYPLITYDERLQVVMTNPFMNQPCDAVSGIEIHPVTGTIYLTCLNNNLFALSKGFHCHAGYEWIQNQQCKTCTIGSAKGPIWANVTYTPQCEICPPGTTAIQPGSAICEECPIGRFQDLSLAQQVCSYCQPGKYQNYSSQTTCLLCPSGQFTSDVGFTQCTNCQPGRYAKSNTSTTCQLCDRGTASNLTGLAEPCPLCPAGTQQLQYGGTSCSSCDLGSFSQSGNECVVCALNSYQPMVGVGCARCDGPNQAGLHCEAGLATVLPGYFAYPFYDPSLDLRIYATTACPPNYCPGSPLQVLNSTSMNGTDSSIQYCLYPRLNSPDNLICASCEDDFIVWGQSCVECTATNGPLLFGIIVFLFLLVGFLLRSGRESAGHLTILIYFLQISALELQQPVDNSNTRTINWLQIFNLSVLSLDTCFAPLTPIQQILFTYASPIILFLILLIIGGGHRLLHHFNLCRRWLRKASLNSYIACTITILLFCYTSVTVMVVRTLNCVTIAPDVTVLWSQPTVDCASEEYHQVFFVTIICLVIYTIGLPVVIFIFLFYRHWTTRSIQPPGTLSLHPPTAIRSSLSWSPSLENDLHEPFQPTAERLDQPAAISPHRSNDLSLSSSTPLSHQPPHDLSERTTSVDGRTILSQFDLRWGALYLTFTSQSWYWQPWILVRRFAFALVSVLVTSNINLTFVLFTVLNIISACVHLWSQPFRNSILNKVEIGSHALLLVISFILDGSGDTRPFGIQILVILLIILPGVTFGIYTLKHHVNRLRVKFRSNPNHSQLRDHDRDRSISIQYG